MTRDEQIAELQQKNTELENRIDALERAVFGQVVEEVSIEGIDTAASDASDDNFPVL